MQLSLEELDPQSLGELGAEARRLLCAGDIAALSERFGFALALGRDPADAIREELASSLTEVGAAGLVEAGTTAPRVSYFAPNRTGLFALVECSALTDSGASILLEVVVTKIGSGAHATLEQVSAAA